MSKVKFDYNQQIFEIKCKEKEKMKDICQKFANQINLNLTELYFKYSEKILDLELPYKKVISSADSKKKCFTVIVFLNDSQTKTKEDIFTKSKQIICPNCSEVALCEINDKDYKIKITCKKGHTNDLYIRF